RRNTSNPCLWKTIIITPDPLIAKQQMIASTLDKPLPTWSNGAKNTGKQTCPEEWDPDKRHLRSTEHVLVYNHKNSKDFGDDHYKYALTTVPTQAVVRFDVHVPPPKASRCSRSPP